ncbi:MAG: ABC transporter ATP-binding protein [Treponema sp.]|nr:ABC transporter ATP-binding protein [Treponema sp.]
MIEAINLCAEYEKKAILKNISFCLKDKGLTMLLGANGSGKSTLLSIIAGVPNNSLKFKNEPMIDNMPISSFSSLKRAHTISFITQNEICAWAYTVREYVSLGYFAKEKDEKLVDWALESFSLETLAERAVTELSGGEFQRAAIARSLVQDTPYILLDEPQANLDIKHQYTLFEILKKIAETKCVVVTMHDINMAAIFAEQILLLSQGSIIADGTVKNVITSENIKKAYDINVKIVEHPIKKCVQIAV